MKKTYLIVMIMLLLFSAACASETPEVFDEEIGVSDENDWNGLEFRINSSYYYDDGTYIFNYRQDSPLGDEVLQRIKDIEAIHNCHIRFTDDENITEMLASGVHPADILYSSASQIRGLGAADLLIPYDDYGNIIDCGNSFLWGTPNLLESVMYQGTLYGLVPASWVGNIGGYYFAVVSNNELIRNAGCPNPSELVENGEWSRETMLDEMIGSTDRTNGIYGVELYPEWWRRICVYANGVKYLERDSSGKYVSGLKSDAVLDALDWSKTALAKLQSEGAMLGANNTSAFFNGSVAFTMVSGVEATNVLPYSTEITDYSVLPFPGNPQYVDYGKWAGYLSVDSTAIGIPYTTPFVDETAILMTELFQPLAGIENENDLIEYYAENVFLNAIDAEVVLANMKYSVCGYIDSGNIFSNFDKMNASSGSKSPAEAVSAYGDAAWGDVEKYVIPNAEAFPKYFGIDYFDYFG